MFEKINVWLYKNNNKLDYLQVLNYAILVFIYLKFWLFPTSNSSFLKDSIHLFAVEFLMVCGSVFISVLAKTRKVFLIILIFGFLIYDLSKIFHNSYFFYAYLLLVFNKMKIAFMKFDLIIFAKNIFNAVVSVIVFLFSALSMAFFEPFIPKFDLTENFKKTSGYLWEMGQESGMLVENPATIMYFWTVYFTLLAVISFWFIKKKHDYQFFGF